MFDDTPFKLNRNIQISVNIKETGKKSVCDKYDDSNNETIGKFVKKHLQQESKVLFTKLDSNKLSKVAQEKFKFEVYKYYDKKIHLCDKAIEVLKQLLEFSDLFDFNININTVKNIKRKYDNPKPLNLKSQPTEFLKLAILLIEDDFNIESDNDFEKWMPINKQFKVSSINDIRTSLEKNMYESSKYWQLTYELALQLSDLTNTSTTDLEKFFKPNLVKEFVIPYQKELLNKTELEKHAIKIFGDKHWGTMCKSIKDVLDKDIYESIYGKGNDTWIESIKWPYNAKPQRSGGARPSSNRGARPSSNRGAESGAKSEKNKKNKKNQKNKKKKVQKFDYWINSTGTKQIDNEAHNIAYLKNKLGYKHKRISTDKNIIYEIYKKFLINPFTGEKIKEKLITEINTKYKKDASDDDLIQINKMRELLKKIYDNSSIFVIDFIEKDFAEEDKKKYKKYREKIVNKLIMFYKICINELCNVKNKIKLKPEQLQKLLAEKPKENISKNNRRKGNRTQGNQPRGNQPRGNKPRGNQPRGNQPRGNKPRGNQPRGNQPRGNQPRGNQPRGNQPRGNQPRGNQPNRPKGDRYNRPKGDRYNRPKGDRSLDIHKKDPNIININTF